MPLFGKKKKEDSQKDILAHSDISNNSSTSTTNGAVHKSKFSFQCQLAHGGPTGIISEFKNIRELYGKIADCYDIMMEEILFCTLNTHKVDMDRLLGSHIGLDDFIFVHVKGQRKEIDLCKSEDSLGLTITDNGTGRSFINRIRPSSQISKLGQGLIDIGDHIEKIDNESFVGRRHYDIAKKLRSIPLGQKFTMRLISPEKSGIYSNLSKRSEYGGELRPNIVKGKKTIRISANNVYEDDTITSTMDELAIEAISRHVEKAIGISDNEMAQTILEIGKRVKNPSEFIEEMNEELGDFGFPNSLIYDFWGVITDAKAGILTSYQDSASTIVTKLSLSSEPTEIYFEDRL